MTSFIIEAQANRPPIPEFWKKDGECAFCQIIHHAAPAHRIYEDNHVIAFLGKLLLRLQDETIGTESYRYIATSPRPHSRCT
jgi:hypothetical protein